VSGGRTSVPSSDRTVDEHWFVLVDEPAILTGFTGTVVDVVVVASVDDVVVVGGIVVVDVVDVVVVVGGTVVVVVVGLTVVDVVLVDVVVVVVAPAVVVEVAPGAVVVVVSPGAVVVVVPDGTVVVVVSGATVVVVVSGATVVVVVSAPATPATAINTVLGTLHVAVTGKGGVPSPTVDVSVFSMMLIVEPAAPATTLIVRSGVPNTPGAIGPTVAILMVSAAGKLRESAVVTPSMVVGPLAWNEPWSKVPPTT